MAGKSKYIVALIIALVAQSIFAEDDAAKFYGKWSWTVLGSSKVEYRYFANDGTFQKLITTVNPIDNTTSIAIDPVSMRYFVNSDVKLLTFRTATAIIIYQYEFLSKDKLLLTDISVTENPTRVFCVKVQS